MADFDNISEINENFNTIKTLLNSIRAQGILNTSDVDKLLSGINLKLDRLNTEEDIDLIKIFLTELKQNFDERHGVLISKFGAIESLFANLLKNSSDMMKTSEIKELFDIVATNLSVFSREVVAQKETLTDINLRLDAFRTDDSREKNIIKNITLLKPDLERLNNGFDSIVLSLNDNFKTLVKTVTSIDKTEYLDRFANNFTSIEAASNMVVSIAQILDKKTSAIEEYIKTVASKEDISNTNKKILELNALEQELSSSFKELSMHCEKFDVIGDKIDASVEIVVGLRAMLQEQQDKQAQSLADGLNAILQRIVDANAENDFKTVKSSLETALNTINENKHLLEMSKSDVLDTIAKLSNLISTLDIDNRLNEVKNLVSASGNEIREHISDISQKNNLLQDAHISKILNDITSSADVLDAKLSQTQNSIAMICEKNFGSLFENVDVLKRLLSQIEENSISANNAIFSNITDRLLAFEKNLKEALESQLQIVSGTSGKLDLQIGAIKNLSDLFNGKFDDVNIEIAGLKNEFTPLTKGINEVLALDFVNVVKDLRVDLYASKKDIENNIESFAGGIEDKIAEDLLSKYQSLLTKLEITEDSLKKVHISSYTEIKGILENISASIVDVLSYVSEDRDRSVQDFADKLDIVVSGLKGDGISYVEQIRDLIDVTRSQLENNLKELYENICNKFDSVNQALVSVNNDIRNDVNSSYKKLLEIQENYKEIKDIAETTSANAQKNLDIVLSASDVIKNDLSEKIDGIKVSLSDKIADFKQEFTCANVDTINEIRFSLDNSTARAMDEIRALLSEVNNNFTDMSNADKVYRSEALTQILNNFVNLNELFKKLDDTTAKNLTESTNTLIESFKDLKSAVDKMDENFDGDMTRQLSIVESNFETLISQITILFEKEENTLKEAINGKFLTLNDEMSILIESKLEDYRKKSELILDELSKTTNAQTECVRSQILDLNNSMKTVLETQSSCNLEQFEQFAENIKNILDTNQNLSQQDSANITNVLEDLSELIKKNNEDVTESFVSRLDNLSELLNSYKAELSETSDTMVSNVHMHINSIIDQNDKISSATENVSSKILMLQNACEDNNNELIGLKRDIVTKFENLYQQDSELNSNLTEKLNNILADGLEEKDIISSGMLKLSGMLEDAIKNYANIQDSILSNSVKVSDILENSLENHDLLTEMASKIYDSQDVVNNNVNSLICQINHNNDELRNEISENIDSLLSEITDSRLAVTNLHDALMQKISDINKFSGSEIADVTSFISDILTLVESQKNEISSVKTILDNFATTEFKSLATAVEKETDAVITELTEQFDLLKKSQNDDILSLTSKVEDLLSSYIYSGIEDLKSYFDIKSDTSVLDGKFESLSVDLSEYTSKALENIDKLLDKDKFKASLEDFKIANEVMLNTLMNGLQDKFEDFLVNNTNNVLALSSTGFKNIENKINLLSKDLKDILTDKYEEIKIISNTHNELLDNFKKEICVSLSNLENEHIKTSESIKEVIAAIEDSQVSSKQSFNNIVSSIVDINSMIDEKHSDICSRFADLKSQIMNRDFDEAFQSSINNEVKGIETLIDNQLGYLQDISDLCVENLPNITELFSLVKHSLLKSVDQFSEKLDNQDLESAINKNLKELKTEIITQFINVFNQISFASEQDEILDFIQEKHDDLISILSHIVTTSDEIKNIKNDILSINEKISQILSSNGEYDYVYSLQELESDIANLRIVLNDMRESKAADDLKNLTASTDEIYKLIETVKEQLPLKSELDDMSENLISISTRTNKLLLASDESYQTLKDNLQEFKLVIDDLDERTRNFHQESGLDKIDAKLNALNSMVQSGAQTNQVFNQIFEYLAEWVDNAGVQISEISDKVETLDDIGQIKVMLQDLKAEAEDDSQGAELAEALGTVFEKQTKRISSLEAKLDKIIVETTINNKNNKIDMTPMEETLNRFLVAIESKISSQQDKINDLECKLEAVMNKINENETIELTKKVGGMDRHITKLNKTIEKIASHVIEK